MRKGNLITALVLMATWIAAGVSAQTNEGDAYQRFLKLTGTVSQTYKNGEAVEAEAQAKELLAIAPEYRADWNYGNAVHTGHLVLGRIAADAGKMAEAKRQLLESVAAANMPYGYEHAPEQPWEQRPKPGKWKASPQMDSFGPDMTLANELLKKGETETVLKYFELCAKFWDMEKGSLAKWKKQIADGETPDFGPNMRYFFGN
jgi:hypothetical protein